MQVREKKNYSLGYNYWPEMIILFVFHGNLDKIKTILQSCTKTITIYKKK